MSQDELIKEKFDNKSTSSKVLTFAVVIIAVIVIGFVGYYFWMSQGIQNEIAELKAAGFPTSIAELRTGSIPPKQNASTYLHKRGATIIGFDDELRGLFEDVNQPLTEKKLEEYDRIVASYGGVHRLIRQAAACKEYEPVFEFDASNFETANTDTSSRFRMAARILLHQSRVELHRKNFEKSLEAALECLKLARLSEKQPTMMGYMSSMAIRGLGFNSVNRVLQSNAKLTSEQHEQIENALKEFESRDGFVWALVSERAVTLDRIKNGGGIPFSSGRSYLQAIQSEIDFVDQDFDKLASLREPVLTKANLVVREQVAPVLFKFRETEENGVARLNALRILNAIKSKNLQAPVEFSELELNEKTMTDPFTGEPMIVKQTDSGWTVYSVGANRVDDGGDVNLNDSGYGPNSLFNVEKKKEMEQPMQIMSPK